MIEGRPSDTALQVAASRAAHLRFDPEPHLLEDVQAESLLGADAARLIERSSNEAPWILRENRLFIPLRARYAEDRLAEAYARGVRQLLLLGAGLDSFVFRQPAELAGLRSFEVDHPSMQAWKRARIEALGWTLPPSARLVPCDFERQSVSDALADSDFDPARPALVSWMGVTYYLERTTTDAALRDLCDMLAAGSEVVFDVMRPWDELPERYAEVRAQMLQYLQGAGEPQVNRYRAEEILRAIHDAGFDEGRIEPREALVARYLAPLASDVPLSHRFHLVTARKSRSSATSHPRAAPGRARSRQARSQRSARSQRPLDRNLGRAREILAIADLL